VYYLLLLAPIALAPMIGTVHAQDRAFGDRLYHEKADCQFCHGIDGDGRGDPRSPGKAPDLHATKLDREQLIEVVRCGRPGSQMPRGAKFAECLGAVASISWDKLKHCADQTIVGR
jgi:mono/diheme cytochrome c family protein